MLTIYTKVYSTHETVMENSLRIKVPISYLEDNGINTLCSDFLKIKKSDTDNLLIKYNSADYIKKFKIDADQTACNFCTSINYINDNFCHMCGNKFNKEIRMYFGSDRDTLITQDTTLELEEVSKVLYFLVENYELYPHAYALIRPPGHHAYSEHQEGFCIVNNAFILASEIIEWKKSKKVLIYDWDLHHGNGTQTSVLRAYDGYEPNIFFVSTHYFAKGFYPGTGNDYIFDPDNFNPQNLSPVYNYPLAKSDTKNFSDYFDQKIVPLLDVICSKVDTIIISNGLDAHIKDPFAKLCFTDQDYVHMTKYFKSKNKKIIFLLEGGYSPEIIAKVSLKMINLFFD